jgi:hypothetical protein
VVKIVVGEGQGVDVLFVLLMTRSGRASDISRSFTYLLHDRVEEFPENRARVVWSISMAGGDDPLFFEPRVVIEILQTVRQVRPRPLMYTWNSPKGRQLPARSHAIGSTASFPPI